MSIVLKLGGIVNSFLKKIGYKIVTVDSKFRMTFSERQLLKALTELSAVYNKYAFENTLTTSPEALALLSNSMYTKFSTGLFLIDYLHKSLNFEGDVCEFGVGQGAISAVLANEMKNTDKTIWLFDSFEGFAEPSEEDVLIFDVLQLGSVKAYKGMMSFPAEMVKKRLSDIHFPPGRIRIVPGFIENSIKSPTLPRTVCFAYVDFDFYEPILTALQYLDTVIQPGGFIIVDDYNFFSHGARTAVDEFVHSRKEKYSVEVPDAIGGNFCVLSRKN